MLQYLCITRPELSFCVNKLSQYMNLPSEMHWRIVKRVLRYLIGTDELNLFATQILIGPHLLKIDVPPQGTLYT
ncbi:Retrovirus-related Pol polyprotein from transposon TNT 1-94 [Gossypium australe]|uniref:Retrovirus-related Pol polyprotein from transposon TNT 1-94 n=1 Tax=Gossypium australe TaxID=47621 RepID=A0A5B6V7D0_9ROSI|nr:Retrovirus-related Pol polyprotein from transposon TNT 1-94 [Gossypium australe]